MSALAQAIDTQEQTQSVTTISANARIDYILRFSKQAVLVVDEQPEHCSNVGSQFLAGLPSDHNAAFISVSPKLNDIQVRCRIVEQLFSGELFDPEQSIAVSLINLAKKQRQAISIIVDNTHFLSLQLIHELCQLAEIAKKANYQINVLMLGEIEAGVIVASNQGLFHKKLSILSAHTGQLLALNSNKFKTQNSFFKWTKKKVWLMIFCIFSFVLSAIVIFLLKQNVLSFSELEEKSATLITDKKTNVMVSPPPKKNKEILVTPVEQEASVADIYLALVTPSATMEVKEPIIAQPQDILAALNEAFEVETLAVDSDVPDNAKPIIETKVIQLRAAEDEEGVDVSTTKIKAEKSLDFIEKDKVALNGLTAEFINEAYYLSETQGYVIQISAFTQQRTLDEFLNDFPLTVYHGYFRRINNKEMLIVTSVIYPSRAQAEEAIKDLPGRLQSNAPWIKALSSIKNEINGLQGSQ